MNDNVVNKQIPLETIIKIANYLEYYKEKFDKKFELEENKNKNLPYIEKKWEYEHGNTNIYYTIEFINGKSIKESTYNWFINNLKKLSIIKNISINLSVTFYTKNPNTTFNDIYNRIYASLYFKENDVNIDINTINQEKEAHNLHSDVTNILKDNENRYNKTMKHRTIRTQFFTISIGFIISYILFFILKINEKNMLPIFIKCLSNKNILIFGQWFIAILLGNFFSHWYILSIYKPLLPETEVKYAGYNYFTGKENPKDDEVTNFVKHSEVHFGKYWDAKKRRTKIEKIFKITKKFILVQLLISITLFFILK